MLVLLRAQQYKPEYGLAFPAKFASCGSCCVIEMHHWTQHRRGWKLAAALTLLRVLLEDCKSVYKEHFNILARKET